MPFDLESPIMLDVLYSMEREKIPVLTELINNHDVRSTIICPESIKEVQQFKWPTFSKPSAHKPIWKKLNLILELVEQNDLVEQIKHYLEKKYIAGIMKYVLHDCVEIPGINKDVILLFIRFCTAIAKC